MAVDDILKQALANTQMIGAPEMWVVEGSAASNIIRITPLEEACQLNYYCFTLAKNNPYMFLGLCSSKEAAEELVERIRLMVRDEEGNNLLQ